jgi:hypothetical protein
MKKSFVLFMSREGKLLKLAYIDSSVWITQFEGYPIYQQIIDDALTSLENDKWLFGISSAVTLEVLLKPYREAQTGLIDAYNRAFQQAHLLPSFTDVFDHALFASQSEHLKALKPWMPST